MTWEGAEESYNVFRWYRAGWGRYSQGDPIGLGGGLNLYAYVGGDPVDATDPSGLYSAKACGSNWVSAAGALNHIPLIGAKINKALGDPNNIIGFCAKCLSTRSPRMRNSAQRLPGRRVVPAPIPRCLLQAQSPPAPGMLRTSAEGC